MKTISKSILCAAAMLALVSCVEETYGPSEKDFKQMTFTGHVDEAIETDAKTGLASDFSVVWNPQDEISVFCTDAHKKFSATNLQEDNKTATFTGLGLESDVYYAVYPHDENNSISGTTVSTTLPTEQQAVANSFAKKVNVSAAKSATQNLEFKNLGALVGFSVTGEGITSVVLSSRDGETLMSGAATVALDGDEPVLTIAESGAKYVELMAPEGGFVSGTRYYFVVAPGTYNGLKLTFKNSVAEATCVKQTAEKVEIGRNGHKTIPAITIKDSDWVGAAYKSYTLNGKAEVEEFVAARAEKEIVINLTLTGDIDNDELSALAGVISEVRETVTFDGVGVDNGGWFELQKFLNKVKYKNVTIKNITKPVDCRNMWIKTIEGDLVLENLPDLVCADWVVGSGSLDTVTEIKGNLTVKNVSKMNGYTFLNLKKVGGSVTIIGSTAWEFACKADAEDPERTVPDRIMSVQSIGGDLVLQDNTNLWTLEGFHELASLGGNVVITGNGDIPNAIDWRYGFCIIKDYQDLGVLKPGATVVLKNKAGEDIDFAALQGCNPSEYKSYVIDGEQQLLDFIAGRGEEKETVNNLYITGADITEGTFRSFDDRVAAVTGTLTIDAVGSEGKWISTDQVLENIDIQGSFIMKNMTATLNPNGIFPKEGTRIAGDFVLENCPTFPTDWDPNKGLVEVGGDLIVRGAMKGFSRRFFPVLEKVGGDFIIEDINEGFWDFKSETLTYIGGDLRIVNCGRFENFTGFHNLTHLGGDVTLIKYASSITGSGEWFPEYNWDGGYGICIFHSYKKSGVMSADATISAYGRYGAGNDYSYGYVVACEDKQ